MSKIFQEIEKIANSNPHQIAVTHIIEPQKRLVDITYHDLVGRVKEMMAYLKANHYCNIAVLLNNSPDWLVIDLACMELEICVTPIPQFFSDEQIHNVIDKAGIEYVITDEALRFSFLQSKAKDCALLPHIDCLQIENPKMRTLHQHTSKITFTSGTTSDPKGVCLSNDNVERTVFSLIERIGKENVGNNLILFPLAILLENIAGIYCNLCAGGKITLIGLEKTGINIAGNVDFAAFILLLESVNPTSFIITPELLKLLIHLKKAKQITLKNANFIALGGASCAKDLLIEAQALALPIYQGYGLSEFASVVSLNAIAENKIGSVGKLLSHIEVTYGDDHHLLLKGNQFLGYVGQEAAKENSQYQSGDIGYVDDQGYLFIQGRKKNIIITSMGRNFSPEWVEGELLKSNMVMQAVLFGDAQKHNIMVIVPSPALQDLDMLKTVVAKLNQDLPDYAKIADFIIATQPFSKANGLLTGTGRPRREKIYHAYQKEISNKA